MKLTEKIIQAIEALPESKQIEVLDYVEYLKAKIEKQDDIDWKNFSLASAMRGMEDEDSPYSLDDIKEACS
ncbi:DUF2281 domain-containing protein [Desulfohalobiaceae bacterium Ax17]|jgi:hypothetical protein|uniref:DUF2281 domain-containing protein n=1 Tax=Desulfovulcanus ferrireducens TaxID=2831190 RepID=UPI00207BCD53|nr:DUF2281 domain-containing protein [Desulfovulcanus ferrireducens]MBT8763391.1 DUF2281 domain-containing protein [Desulfovulcanus ferrireducens]